MIQPLDIPEVKLITPKKIGDDRGFFSETFNQASLVESGVDLNFVQDNHSYSAAKGVLRGLHYQAPPFAQDKLVRCTKGRIYDVAVDIRKGSPTFGQYVGAELSEENWTQILVPKGFAHGFITLEDGCEVQYKVTNYYSKECDRNIAWNDPDIAIEWPIDPELITLSDKDTNAPLLSKVDLVFTYESEHASGGAGQ
ncbi:dTDP-4-dehydrorhamnose 3,5-epimerase [Henriciella litoralis]|uniref:dTDP-4-dehydrorhamnose 3,5-epimerase n=1 Tax=Henriciella litoralis TaxID=568102 RepID=UPI0009FFE03F|nr:dTDP-4-dehydrorhamnose 3,5-epimerase [Henriciella litoralis]